MRAVMPVLVWLGFALAAVSNVTPDAAVGARSEDELQPVRVLDSGFAVAAPSATEDPATAPRRVTVALVIENPNTDLAAEGLRLRLRMVDQTGAPLGGRSIAVAQLLPGERRNIVASEILGPDRPAVAAVEASVTQVLRWRRVGAVPLPTVELTPPLAGFEALSVPGLSFVRADTFTPSGVVGTTIPTAEATITNALDAFVAGLDVAAVAFDQEGRIIGGGMRTLALAPQESAHVTVPMTVSTEIRAIARLEVTAAYPWIDLLPYAR